MAMVARCCGMRLACAPSCSPLRSSSSTFRSVSSLLLHQRTTSRLHSSGGFSHSRASLFPCSRAGSSGGFPFANAARTVMALGPKQPAFEMRSLNGAFSTSAQTSPDENENDDEQLLSGGTLKSDGTGGGGHGGRGGGGSGGHGDPHRGGNKPMHPILAWYMKLLEERPVTTKAVTAAILTFIGDLFTQLVIEKSGGIDVKRIIVITSLGLLLVGPTLHYWYLTLSRVVKIGGVQGTGVRLLLDQLLFSPIFIGVFFVCLLTLEGRPSDIGPKLARDWPSAVVTNWKLWVPFQFVNFMFVPQQLQVAFANVVSLIWNAYLSFATHTEVDSKGK